MAFDGTKRIFNAWIGAWLILSIHFDAARATPRKYLTALWWRLQGKRLRARSQLAPLLGASHRAYRLWVLEKESRKQAPCINGALSEIVALVDTGMGHGELDATLKSLAAEGIAALLVDGRNTSAFADAVQLIEWRNEPWLMPLAAGDILALGAAGAYKNAIANVNTKLAYADDDLLDEDGQRIAPHFKPDWNAELFRHFDFLTGACIVRTSVEELQNLAHTDWAGSLVARAAENGSPVHIPQVLHHRRSRPRPKVPAALRCMAQTLPSISIIVPTRNRLDLLQTCLEGLGRTEYPDMEILVVDNDSDDPETLAYLAGLNFGRQRVLHYPGPFNFSAINNHAAVQARGELLCLLNNDIEVIEPHWLKTMAAQAIREEVGAVGAQLLYPDGRLQHAGVVVGVGGGAAHAHRLLRPEEEGYFRRHALPQFVSAVTAACLVVRREHFLAVGGLDEHNFAVAFNDVDLCMRLNCQGWQTLYEPRARLIHHESVSRGFDRDPIGATRLAGELAALKHLWDTDRNVDPYHHPQLSPFSERFVVRL